MITDALLVLLNTLLGWGVALLPSWSMSLPAQLADVLSQIRAYDDIMPVTETLSCVGLMGTLVALYSGVKWTIKLIDWVADVLP